MRGHRQPELWAASAGLNQKELAREPGPEAEEPGLWAGEQGKAAETVGLQGRLFLLGTAVTHPAAAALHSLQALLSPCHNCCTGSRAAERCPCAGQKSWQRAGAGARTFTAL